MKRPDESSIVAVKMLKEGHTDVEMVDLFSEMDMMKVIFIRIYNLVRHCSFPKVHLSIGVLAPRGRGGGELDIDSFTLSIFGRP